MNDNTDNISIDDSIALQNHIYDRWGENIGTATLEYLVSLVREHDFFESPFTTPCNKHKNISAYIVKNAPDNECFGCYMDAIKANERQRCIDAFKRLLTERYLTPDQAELAEYRKELWDKVEAMQEKQE